MPKTFELLYGEMLLGCFGSVLRVRILLYSECLPYNCRGLLSYLIRLIFFVPFTIHPASIISVDSGVSPSGIQTGKSEIEVVCFAYWK